ncbi:MAG TPA: DUF4350 domain-containing protein [Vicinamibacterales bacterium]|jgi:hypothetical protein
MGKRARGTFVLLHIALAAALARGIAEPAAADGVPTIAIDEAHGHEGAASGFFKPLADLLKGDGGRVVPYRDGFAAASLAAIDVLVVPGDGTRIGDREGDLVRDWVRGGGSLLVAATAPAWVDAGERLAARFGVEAGGGRVFDRLSGGGITTALEFSRGNGRLGDHPILRGRGRTEQIARVRTAAGESLGVPRGAAALLKLSATAREAMTRDDLESEEFAARQEAGIAGSFSIPVAGRAQAVALPFGKGRLVVLGDASLLSAAGLGASDADNRQFALNVVHWLSRRLT